MKFLKSILLSTMLLIAFGAGACVAASTPTQNHPPTQYIGQDGNPATPPTPIQKMPNMTDSSTAVTIPASASNNWYWAGADATPATGNEQSILLTLQSLKITGNGTVNIVVGPGSDVTNSENATSDAAVVSTGGLEIPSGVEVNIYQSVGALITKKNCFFKVNGTAGSGTPTYAVTVNGTLNVYSGAFEAIAASSGGASNPVQIGPKGILNVGTYGSLEADAPASSDSTPGEAINITSGGTFTIEGAVACYGETGTKPSRADGTIGGTLTDFSINGGFLMAGNTYSSIQSNCKNGLLASTNSSGTSTMTAFGTSNMRMNVFILGIIGSDGKFTTPLILGSNESLTVLPGANFSFPDYIPDYPFNFGNGSKLIIEEGATVTIPNRTNISMLEGSTLENSGTITVEPPETTTQS